MCLVNCISEVFWFLYGNFGTPLSKPYSLKCFEIYQTGGLDLMLFTLRSTSVAAARSWTSCWWQILQVVSDKSENKTTANLHNPLCHLEFDFLSSKKQSGSRSGRKTIFAKTSKQYFIALLWYIFLSDVFAISVYLSALKCFWLCLRLYTTLNSYEWSQYLLCTNTWYRASKKNRIARGPLVDRTSRFCICVCILQCIS